MSNFEQPADFSPEQERGPEITELLNRITDLLDEISITHGDLKKWEVFYSNKEAAESKILKETHPSIRQTVEDLLEQTKEANEKMHGELTRVTQTLRYMGFAGIADAAESSVKQIDAN